MAQLKRCEACNRVDKDGHFAYCKWCHVNHLEPVVLLYQKIVREMPKARQLTMPEVFNALYDHYKKCQNR